MIFRLGCLALVFLTSFFAAAQPIARLQAKGDVKSLYLLSEGEVAYVYQKGNNKFLHVRSQDYGPFDRLEGLSLSADGSRIACIIKDQPGMFVWDGVKEHGPFKVNRITAWFKGNTLFYHVSSPSEIRTDRDGKRTPTHPPAVYQEDTLLHNNADSPIYLKPNGDFVSILKEQNQFYLYDSGSKKTYGPYEFVEKLEVTPQGKIAYIARQQNAYRGFIEGKQVAGPASSVDIHISPQGKIFFLVREGDSYFIVHEEGKWGPYKSNIRSYGIGHQGPHLFYGALKDTQWFVWQDGKPLYGPFDSPVSVLGIVEGQCVFQLEKKENENEFIRAYTLYRGKNPLGVQLETEMYNPSPVISPDGKKIVYWGKDKNGKEGIFINDTLLRHTEKIPYKFTFSPDGKQVAYYEVGKPTNLFINAEKVTGFQPLGYYPLSFSADGKALQLDEWLIYKGKAWIGTHKGNTKAYYDPETNHIILEK